MAFWVADLVVGAYQSGAVLLLQARPIINVTTTLQLTELDGVDPGRAGCPLDQNSAHACFAFSACFRLEPSAVVNATGGGQRQRETMAIRSVDPVGLIFFLNGHDVPFTLCTAQCVPYTLCTVPCVPCAPVRYFSNSYRKCFLNRFQLLST